MLGKVIKRIKMEKPQSNRILERYRAETAELLKKRQASAAPEGAEAKMPKRAEFRMRAHCNPLSDTPFPLCAKQPAEPRPRRLESALPEGLPGHTGGPHGSFPQQ